MKLFAAMLLGAAALAHAQTPPAPPLSPASAAMARLQQVCATLPQQPTEARALAQRSQCVLLDVLPSARPFAEARELARKSMALGEAAGGFMLYVAFHDDPENSYLRDGKPDVDLYRKLSERSMEQRREQVEAIDALAFAAAKGHVNAGILLAHLFHDTVAPRNVARLSALVELLTRAGQGNPDLERLGREADAVGKAAPQTKASVRAFLDAYRAAVGAALTGYSVQTGGKTCSEAILKSASSGEIAGAEYLPLKNTLAVESYLVHGQWQEFWTFTACGEEVPVKVTFTADGWGGAGFSAVHNKGT